MSKQGTSDYIIGISIGPVGGFISAGRRSRDLWYGSRLVAEVTRIVAQNLDDDLVTLSGKVRNAYFPMIVPPRDRLTQPFLPSYQGPMISNRIVARAECTTRADIEWVLSAARQKALDFIVQQIEHLLQDGRFASLASMAVLKDQQDAIRHGDFVEFFAGAVPIVGDKQSDAIRKVNELLDGVKGTRTYLVPASEPGWPKSSRDPGWDSALFEDAARAFSKDSYKVLEFERAKVGIRHEERLDAIGLIRRRAMFIGAKADLPPLPFPPLSRIAADAWIEGVWKSAPRTLSRVARALDDLRRKEPEALMLFATPCREPGKSFDAIPTIFGYDASLLLEGGIDALMRATKQIKEAKRRQQALAEGANIHNAITRAQRVDAYIESAMNQLKRMKSDVAELHERFGTPHPYYALIEADGDGVGTLLERVHGNDRESIIKGLYDFADDAWDVIDKTHGGAAFYVGGDELAAYLPLDKAFAAVRALVDLFEKKVGNPARNASLGATVPPTLSVGMVVGQIKDDLRSVRRKGREALANAKERRRQEKAGESYLSIVEAVRGAADRGCIGQTNVLLEDVEQWQTSLGREDGLSMSMMQSWLERIGQGFDDGPLIELIKADLVQRSRRAGRVEPDADLVARVAKRIKTGHDLREIIHEVLLASRLRKVAEQRQPTANAKETT